MQAPPALFVVAALRIVIGSVLVLAARASRAPVILRVLGCMIVVGGLLTPFLGARGARMILDWWAAGGPGLVRVWAAVALAAGGFMVSALAPDRRAA